MDKLSVEELGAEYDRLFKLNSGRDPPRRDEQSFEEVMARAKEIKADDLTEARRLIEAAAWLQLNEPERDIFLNAVKKSLGAGTKIKQLLWFWNAAAAKVAAANAPTPEEAATMEAAKKKAAAEQRRLEAERLGRLSAGIAKDPDLLERMIDTVAALGVVGERGNVLAVYLSVTSRLLRRRCLSLLRRGAPASGKNYLIEQVLELIPAESVVRFNSASPQALIYHGGGDPDSLKHKVVYLPEASLTLAERHGVESEFTSMMRQMISDNRISRSVAVAQKEGLPISVEVVKNGPISVVVTSARSDVEDELLTRMLLADSDESETQTKRVVDSQLAIASGEPWIPAPEEKQLDDWRNFQRWLEANGPYEVRVPFSAAIKAAAELPTEVRMRRDISGMVMAISASAIIHKAQRRIDGEGRIVATVDDYAHAFEAFAPGVAALYQPQLSAGVIALVKVIETLVEAEPGRIEKEKARFREQNPGESLPFALEDWKFDKDARATRGQLKAALGIASGDAVTARIQDALNAGVIERTNPDAPRSAGARYRVKISTAELEKSAGVSSFPTPAMVMIIANDPVRLAEAKAELALGEGQESSPDSCRELAAAGENDGEAEEEEHWEI